MQISLSAFTGIWAKVFPTKRFWAPNLAALAQTDPDKALPDA